MVSFKKIGIICDDNIWIQPHRYKNNIVSQFFKNNRTPLNNQDTQTVSFTLLKLICSATCVFKYKFVFDVSLEYTMYMITSVI